MKRQIEDMTIKEVLAPVVAATMGLSSTAFTVKTATTPTPTATTTRAAPVKTTHHKKQRKAVPVQKAQAAKEHHRSMKAKQKAPEQKAQAAKKHARKHSRQQPAKPTARPAA